MYRRLLCTQRKPAPLSPKHSSNPTLKSLLLQLLLAVQHTKPMFDICCLVLMIKLRTFYTLQYFISYFDKQATIHVAVTNDSVFALRFYAF
jgi:hypothetical protein